jgi:hypothetical protein
MMKGRRRRRGRISSVFLFSVFFLERRKKTEKRENGRCKRMEEIMLCSPHIIRPVV